ncbi:MAG TPA: bifunctional phosphoribosylaminoimidazolecarboxamide formyltransferase/IMP cyclohydrolase [Ignavibacteria bacterium]|nr:bifunctional phosphoribosylaminoimidazolecarboxamide formyltransferase/IMP cyclohydrolase [Ignavibacteria bacterium]
MKIKKALISVYDKTGIIDFAKNLNSFGIEIISTGGTYKLLIENGIKVKSIIEITRFPEILNGRVKTLHPNIFGGILADKNIEQHLKEISDINVTTIDLVIVNLYPFKETIEKPNVTEKEIIEEIDIGGVSLIRAAAKNFNSVSVIHNVNQYKSFIAELKQTDNDVSKDYNRKLASEAFNYISLYDKNISDYFNQTDDNGISISLKNPVDLRYGENPHQTSTLYKDNFDHIFSVKAGKELSYNNLLDLDAAYGLINEFRDDEPTCAIIKHGNPCGVASAESLSDAYLKAFQTDTDSPFGGILIFNKRIDFKTSQEVNKLFFEILAAPGFDPDAYDFLNQKKNRRLIEFKFSEEKTEIRKIYGGFLLQDKDNIIFDKLDLRIVTEKKPDENILEDMYFATKIVKHIKSNAICFVKNRQTLGIGGGQPSRIESTKIAVMKASHYKNDLKDSIVSSDAFFPFSDGVEQIIKTGAVAIVQPGGSVRDPEVIETANKSGIIMALTGVRHFKH